MPTKPKRVANDDIENAAGVLQAEVDRAVCDLRRALSEMAKQCRLHPSLMGVITLLDKVEFHVIYDPGESAFELNEEAGIVSFRSSGLEMVLAGAEQLVEAVGYDVLEESVRVRQLAINLFIAHELLHISQNFPHFPTVAQIKAGAPGIGLPLLDAVADIVAASICAHAEHLYLEGETQEDFLRAFANMLVLAYAIGSVVFDARTKPEKRQRALGLLVSAAMIQSLAEGRLNTDRINPAWKPTSPLFLLNIASSGAFNAFVVDEIAGVLFSQHAKASGELALELWESVGTKPVQAVFELVVKLLVQMEVILASERGGDKG